MQRYLSRPKVEATQLSEQAEFELNMQAMHAAAARRQAYIDARLGSAQDEMALLVADSGTKATSRIVRARQYRQQNVNDALWRERVASLCTEATAHADSVFEKLADERLYTGISRVTCSHQGNCDTALDVANCLRERRSETTFQKLQDPQLYTGTHRPGVDRLAIDQQPVPGTTYELQKYKQYVPATKGDVSRMWRTPSKVVKTAFVDGKNDGARSRMNSKTKAKSKKDNDKLYARLTDSSLYTGSHKHRFDSHGRGRGLQGRDRAAKGTGNAIQPITDGDVVREISQLTRGGVRAYACPSVAPAKFAQTRKLTRVFAKKAADKT
eukprot:SAG31_NODE_2461_length_5657_cov_31.641778_2_plen_325_part_00